MTDTVADELKPNAPTLGASAGLPPEEIDRLTDDIIAALKTVYDPEIPSDIYELGLIYRVDIADDRVVTIDMTLTAPGCPVAGEMPGPGTSRACRTRPASRSTCGDRRPLACDR
jgi:hypothetical protein